MSSLSLKSYQEDRQERGVYDKRNPLNDLTGKEWLFSTKTVLPKIAVLDTFRDSDQYIDVNGDNCPDISHGELVNIYLRNTLKEDVELVPFEVGLVSSNKVKIHTPLMLDALKEIEKRDDIGYVNVSIAESHNLETPYYEKEFKNKYRAKKNEN